MNDENIVINGEVLVGSNGAKLNDLNNYDYNEIKIGKMDGKDLYRRIYYLASFPNKSQISIPTGLSNVNYVNMYGLANGNNNAFPINVTRVGFPEAQIEGYIQNNNIIISTCGTDRSSYHGWIIIEYFKN